jgi:hypothetical protein
MRIEQLRGDRIDIAEIVDVFAEGCAAACRVG